MNNKEIIEKEPTNHYKVDMDKVIEYVTANHKLGDLHGFSHWQRVAKNGDLLLQPGVNPYGSLYVL